ncbi:MAG: hypothetical protein ACOY90_21670 [Candidatus Zhuqueibacterota bacterium]
MKNAIFYFYVVMLIFSVNAHAANRYIRSDATGNNSGADWLNAYTSFPSSLIRGDKYYVADGTYSGYHFDDAEQDTHSIYIMKATESEHGTNTGWQPGFGDGVVYFTNTLYFESDYWILNGIIGSQTTPCGMKITTSNATSDSKLLQFNNSASNIKIYYIEMEHCGEDNNYRQDIVYCNTSSTDILISHCYMHNVNRNIFTISGGSNWIIEYNIIADRHTNSDIHGQHIQGGPSLTSYITIRYNIFRNCRGTGYIVPLDNNHHHWYVFGNLFYTTNLDRYGSSSGLFGDTTGDECDYMYFYNNTVIDQGAMNNGVDFHKINPIEICSFNNLFYNATSGDFFNNGENDYNLYDDLEAANSLENGQYWPSEQSDLFIDYLKDDFQLNSSTESGKILPDEYKLDMNGNVRGADGNWDRGAFEYDTQKVTPKNFRFLR